MTKKLTLLLLLLFLLLPLQAWGATSAQTKLLCHFNGADAATTYTSDDANARTATFVGTAQLDTAQKKFGTASLNVPSATSDYLTFPDSADWAFGTSDLTIDLWVYYNSLPGTDSTGIRLVNQYVDSTHYGGLYVYKSSATSYQWGWKYVDGSIVVNLFINITTPATGQWYHYALTRSGSSYRFFINGVQQGATQTDAASVPNLASALYIGHDGWLKYFDGWIDELRIVVGSAEWTADFTPPTAEYSFPQVIIISE